MQALVLVNGELYKPEILRKRSIQNTLISSVQPMEAPATPVF
jgi:hypothetical protein